MWNYLEPSDVNKTSITQIQVPNITIGLIYLKICFWRHLKHEKKNVRFQDWNFLFLSYLVFPGKQTEPNKNFFPMFGISQNIILNSTQSHTPFLINFKSIAILTKKKKKNQNSFSQYPNRKQTNLEATVDVFHGNKLLGLLVPQEPCHTKIPSSQILHYLVLVHLLHPVETWNFFLCFCFNNKKYISNIWSPQWWF